MIGTLPQVGEDLVTLIPTEEITLDVLKKVPLFFNNVTKFGERVL